MRVPLLSTLTSRVLPVVNVQAKLSLLRALGVNRFRHRLENGSTIQLRPNDILTPSLMRDASFEREVQKYVCENVREGMTVLDIGANIGFFSIVMSRLVGPSGTVIAFEPNPVVSKELRANLGVNGITNTTIKEVALSNETGFADFCLPLDGMESHGSLQANSSFQTKRTLRVPTRTLDEIAQEERWPPIGFVKMDVEGAELLVLGGATQLLSVSPKPRFVFEASELLCEAFGHSVFDLLFEFRRNGFKVREIDYGAWSAEPD